MELLYDDPYVGNIELANKYVVTFLASCATPEENWAKVERWLEEEIYGTDKVVMSGFHSPFEQRVLQRLFDHKHPAILYLARSLYKRPPQEYTLPLAENRLLILAYYEQCDRISYRHSSHRNSALINMADEVVTIGVTQTSKISTMLNLLRQTSNKAFREL